MNIATPADRPSFEMAPAGTWAWMSRSNASEGSPSGPVRDFSRFSTAWALSRMTSPSCSMRSRSGPGLTNGVELVGGSNEQHPAEVGRYAQIGVAPAAERPAARTTHVAGPCDLSRSGRRLPACAGCQRRQALRATPKGQRRPNGRRAGLRQGSAPPWFTGGPPAAAILRRPGGKLTVQPVRAHYGCNGISPHQIDEGARQSGASMAIQGLMG